MKYLMLCFSLILAISCTPAYKPHKITIEDNFIEVQFGRKMSRELLDSIQQVLETKGIHLAYSKLNYDGDKLNELEFLISDGVHTGTAKTNFVNKIKPFGFRVDRRAGAMSPLKVGEL